MSPRTHQHYGLVMHIETLDNDFGCSPCGNQQDSHLDTRHCTRCTTTASSVCIFDRHPKFRCAPSQVDATCHPTAPFAGKNGKAAHDTRHAKRERRGGVKHGTGGTTPRSARKCACIIRPVWPDMERAWSNRATSSLSPYLNCCNQLILAPSVSSGPSDPQTV